MIISQLEDCCLSIKHKKIQKKLKCHINKLEVIMKKSNKEIVNNMSHARALKIVNDLIVEDAQRVIALMLDDVEYDNIFSLYGKMLLEEEIPEYSHSEYLTKELLISILNFNDKIEKILTDDRYIGGDRNYHVATLKTSVKTRMQISVVK